jgi:ATP/maltotriose-dependent transcriptional regulator MalT
MLSCQEDYFHQQSHEEVPAEVIDLESADEFLREQAELTSYAASSFLIAETTGLLRVKELLPRADAARLGARLAILTELQLEKAEGVKKIEFMAQSVVTGALRQYLAQQPEEEMAKLSKQRADNTALNTRIYSASGLASVAEFDLQRKIEKQSWIVRRLLSKPAQEPVKHLQTEVDEVELAA